MSSPWTFEAWRALGVAGAAFLVGLVAGKMALWLLIGAVAYLAWLLVNLYRFERWLRGGAGSPPVEGGVWGEIYYHIYRYRQRHWARKRKLSAYLGRFRELTAAMPDATVVLRAGGEIEWFNDAAQRLLGLRAAQDVGQHILNLVRYPAFVAYFNAGRFAEPIEIPAPQDERLRLTVTAVPYGKEQLLLVARDITRLHRLEQVRRDFVANVSHELRTPLTVINGYLETMADAVPGENAQWRQALDAMQQQAARMQHIVEDLLLLSRLETEQRPPFAEPIDVPAMIAAIEREALDLSAGAHEISASAEAGLDLRGNARELCSAFTNLVSNATRYTPRGGQIAIRWYGNAAGAHFEVRDTGAGIASHHIPRLTERFYRVDAARSRQSGGTGLGLAIVKHVLERHDATLRIDSTVGEGSTFTCDFPLERIVKR